MAKKIFCDVCGNEMLYEDIQPYLKGQSTIVNVVGDGNRKLQFDVHVKVVPEGVGNGEHVDICGSCRLFLLDKLDRRSLEEMESSRADVQASTEL